MNKLVAIALLLVLISFKEEKMFNEKILQNDAVELFVSSNTGTNHMLQFLISEALSLTVRLKQEMQMGIV